MIKHLKENIQQDRQEMESRTEILDQDIQDTRSMLDILQQNVKNILLHQSELINNIEKRLENINRNLPNK